MALTIPPLPPAGRETSMPGMAAGHPEGSGPVSRPTDWPTDLSVPPAREEAHMSKTRDTEASISISSPTTLEKA